MRATLLPALAVLLAAGFGPAADPPDVAPAPPAAPTLTVIDPAPAPTPPAPANTLELPAGRAELLQIGGYKGKAVRWRASSPAVLVVPLKAKTEVRFTGPTPPVRETVTGGGPTVELVHALKAGYPAPSKHTTGTDPAALVLPVGSGEATVEADGTDANGEIVTLLSIKVRAGTGPQPPPTPVDPPTPKPVDPADASPFPDPGFRVLVTWDANNTTRPAAQNSVLYGAAVRDYLKRKCVAEPTPEPGTDGRGYRFYPAGVDTSRAPKVWADAYAKAAAKGKDWVLIGDGQKGYSGPLPATEADMLTLLKKYGGE